MNARVFAFLAIVAIVSAANLRSRVESESRMCSEARKHVSFLQNKISQHCVRPNARQCQMLKSALALLQNDDDTTAVDYEGEKEAKDEAADKVEEIADAEDEAHSERVANHEAVHGEAAKADTVSYGDHADMANTDIATNRAKLIRDINKHMENVKAIFDSMKKEHIDKCTSANAKQAAKAKNAKETEAKTAQDFEELTDEALGIKDDLEATLIQHERTKWWRDQLSTVSQNFESNFCEVYGYYRNYVTFYEAVTSFKSAKDASHSAEEAGTEALTQLEAKFEKVKSEVKDPNSEYYKVINDLANAYLNTAKEEGPTAETHEVTGVDSVKEAHIKEFLASVEQEAQKVIQGFNTARQDFEKAKRSLQPANFFEGKNAEGKPLLSNANIDEKWSELKTALAEEGLKEGKRSGLCPNFAAETTTSKNAEKAAAEVIDAVADNAELPAVEDTAVDDKKDITGKNTQEKEDNEAIAMAATENAEVGV